MVSFKELIFYNIKWLKLIYLLIYLNLCISIAYLYLFKNLNSYTNLVEISSLNVNRLKKLINLRGIIHNDVNEKSELKSLIKNSGTVIESELTNANLIASEKYGASKVFNSAGEFLESVEDSRDSVWLVQIVMNNYDEENTINSHFVNFNVWSQLGQLSRFGILTGIFNCENDYSFCQMRGWDRPQLVLGMVKYDSKRYPNEFVELFLYQNSKRNKLDHIVEWVELMLRNRLNNKNDNNHNNEKLKLYYIQNETNQEIFRNTRVPLYYSSLSVKFNRRASFHFVKSNSISNNLLLFNRCFKDKSQKVSQFTPIYLIIDDNVCYNYGTNLNEIPNYQNLNQFLIFLYPDMNNLFSISFLFLNAYLFMFFFEYNKSFLKQICRGLIYLCICNFVLFSIWLLTINTSSKEILKISSLISTCFNRIFVWLRYFIMYNNLTQHVISYVRFLIYFYVFINSYLALFIYVIFCICFYIHTRYVYIILNQPISNSIKLVSDINNTIDNNNSCRKNKLKSFFLIPIKNDNDIRIELNNNNNENSNSNVLVRSQSPQQHIDIDVDISVSELINQINGLTTIWLHSSTYADRLISELPSIEYCKCFYINTIRVHALDETDKDETTDDDLYASETESVSEKKFLKKSASRHNLNQESCECGKNNDLKLYLNKNDLSVLWSKFSRSCSICLENYKFGCLIALLPCGHLFHRKCIYEWFLSSVNYQCPVCRTSFYKFKKIN